MAIESIDVDKCIGCGQCVLTCPMDVLRMDTKTKKSKVVYPEDCQICSWCREYCPTDALVITPYKYNERMTAWA